jgi:probable HAF family extracellular repeat protein
MAINERGDIVGFSNPAGPGDPSGEFIAHAFLWTRSGGMEDLGTLPGDETSQAFAINERRQVVGVSSGPGGNRAFLWQNGVMRDLGALVAAESPDALQSARDIDDAGQITGNVLDDGSGSTLTFVATPKPRER